MVDKSTPLGMWIKNELDAQGKNQAWLASKVGVQPPQISRIISGQSEPSPDLLGAIAEALGKPRSQAFRAAGYIEPVTKADEDIEEIMNEYRNMTEGERNQALAVIRMLNKMFGKKK